MNNLADVLVLFALVASFVFPGAYLARSNWRATRAGRSMLYLSIALAALLSLNFASIYFNEYPGRGTVRSLVYLTLVLTYLGLIRTLIRVQNGQLSSDLPPKLHNTKENVT